MKWFWDFTVWKHMLKKTSIIRAAIIRVISTYRFKYLSVHKISALECSEVLLTSSIEDWILEEQVPGFSDSNWHGLLESLSVCFFDWKNVFTFTFHLSFFALQWLTRACLLIFDNLMSFLDNLHLALLPCFALVNQDWNWYSSSQLALNKIFFFILLIFN